MRLFLIAAVLFSVLLNSATVARAATTPVTNPSVTIQVVLEKIATLKIKDIQQLAGRKLTLKEKVSFWLLKEQLKKKNEPRFVNKLATKLFNKKSVHKAGTANAGEPRGMGQTAFIFGLAGAILMVAAFLVPYLFIPSMLSAILALALGTIAYKRDSSDAKAKAGKLLGWITLGLWVVLLTIVLIAWTSSSWW